MAIASFAVRVVNDDGDGIKGARVRLEFAGLRGMSASEYTDDGDRAEFNGYGEGEIEIYVDGKGYGSCSYRDREEVTIEK